MTRGLTPDQAEELAYDLRALRLENALLKACIENAGLVMQQNDDGAWRLVPKEAS